MSISLSCRASYSLTALALAALASASAASSAGCAETIREYGSGGAGGEGGADPSSTVASTSGAGGAGGVGGAGGAGGVVLPECMPGQPPYAGSLCGSADLPCALHTDELLPNEPAFRNDSPGVALDDNCTPHFIFSVAEGGFHGFYAKRDAPGAYSVEETPFPVATAGIGVAATGDVYVAADDGAFGVTMFQRSQGQWNAGVQLMGKLHSIAKGFAEDANGLFHMGSGDSSEMGHYATFNVKAQAWSLTTLGTVNHYRIPIAVTPAGDAHVAYWTSGNGWLLNWQMPTKSPEVATPLGSNLLDSANQRHSIAVTPGDMNNPGGVPHILMMRSISPMQPEWSELVYLVRKGANDWSLVTVDQESSAPSNSCNAQPQSMGLMCNYDYIKIFPIGLLASQNGDVRAVYNRVHRVGTSVSQCDMQFMYCYWVPSVDNSEGQIVIAEPGGGQMGAKSTVGEKVFFQGAMVTLDTVGRLHIAAYDAPPLGGDSTVRYLVIGP